EVNYAIAVSTCAGLWSYLVGDTVRLVSRDPPRLLVTGRTAYSLSAFGEHLIGEEIEEAVSRAAAGIGAMVADYSVGAVFPEGSGELGGHVYVAEFAGQIPDAAALETFAAAVDGYLKDKNEDYAAHRAGGFGMKAPAISVMRPGGFAAWMKTRGRLGGQNKVPRIINDRDLFSELRRFAAGVAIDSH
ncbi:MAG: GH3 family domain-containing protein, partial [Alphaproteobacteria bacterium]